MIKNKGMVWCQYHNQLLSYCPDFAERVKTIENTKPANEVPVRLYEMQLFEGKLPEEIVKAYKAINKACKAYDKAYKALNKAYKAYDKVYKAYDKACETYNKAYKAYEKAYKAYDKACETCNKMCKTYKIIIEELHKKEVPDTCWNGEELDFKKVRK